MKFTGIEVTLGLVIDLQKLNIKNIVRKEVIRRCVRKDVGTQDLVENKVQMHLYYYN